MTKCLWPNGTKTRPLVSSGFGPRNLSNPLASKYHRGTDFYGFPVVHSIADGVVVFVGWYRAVGWSSVAGYMVWVQHDGFFSRYLHNDPDTVRVREGEHVRAGQPLIGMGWSGLANPWDSHSHVEITPGEWRRGNTGQVDPVAFIQSRIDKPGVPAGIDLGAPVPADNGGTSVTEIEGIEDMARADHRFYRHQKDGRVFVVAGGRSIDLSEKDARKLIDIQRLNHQAHPQHYLPMTTFGDTAGYFNLDQDGWNLMRAVYPPRA